MTDGRASPNQLGEGEADVEKNVRAIFNEQAEEYDHLRDLWYQYTFGFIRNVLEREFRLQTTGVNPLALDLGCGTGIQSLQLASMGYRVVGIDIADKLVRIANSKLKGYDGNFALTDLENLPFKDSIADCANCCGPTLSFVPNWRRGLREISRCLKRNGKLLLEVEGKWNPDLFWEILNALRSNCLEYDEDLNTAVRHLSPPWATGPTISYSFKTESGSSVPMPLKLFSGIELRRELHSVGLIEDKKWGLHALTNLIPSTILHRSNPSARTRAVFSALASLEKRVNQKWPVNDFACSVLVLAHKQAQ